MQDIQEKKSKYPYRLSVLAPGKTAPAGKVFIHITVNSAKSRYKGNMLVKSKQSPEYYQAAAKIFTEKMIGDINGVINQNK